MSSTNQQILLDTLLEQKKDALDSTIGADDFFHLFVSEQILKDQELSYEEQQEGVVDNGGDGGIDSIYTFVNSEIIQRDTALIDGKRGAFIDVYIIQSKNTNGFSETAIEKCISSANDLFDFTKDSDSLKSVYNDDLLRNREIFQKQYLHLASKFPTLRFYYFYATKGTEVHPNVERKVTFLQDTINKHFDKAEVSFQFLTAGKLIELSRREQIKTKSINYVDNPISTQDGGYILIVPLKNYYDFISDGSGNLIKYFFDSNIRDYQGDTIVNTQIRDTLLASNSNEDFWWLNNGVTITATNAFSSSKQIVIQDPQIVNGLQTSSEIFNYFSVHKIESEQRSVLVRIVKTENEESRLKVIKSTNSQTTIPTSSLRATDHIHKDIEEYLLSKGFYYDRRKNYYKNQERPLNKIISISHLAQIVMSTLQQKPDYARARPSTLIKNNSDYEGIFNSKLPIDLYYKLVYVHKEVERALKAFNNPKLTKTQIGDIRFHVTMCVVCILTNKIKPTGQDIANISLDTLTSIILDDAIEKTYIVFDLMGGTNAIAKGKEFVKELLTEITLDIKN